MDADWINIYPPSGEAPMNFRRVAVLASLSMLVLSALVIPASHSQVRLQTPSMLPTGASSLLDEQDFRNSGSLTQRFEVSRFPNENLIADRVDRFQERIELRKARARQKVDALKFRALLRQSMATGTTYLETYNPSSGPILVWLTVPQTSNLGGPTLMQYLQANDAKTGVSIPITIPFQNLNPSSLNNPRLGYFTLNNGQTAIVASNNPGNATNVMDGVTATFLTAPQCPCNSGCVGTQPFVPGPNVPNGTNFGEVTLNPPAGFQESADISCVNGASTTILMSLSGGPNWNNGNGNNNVTSAQNSWVDIANSTDNNCGLTGVFPYNLTKCTTANGGACAPFNPFCSNTQTLCALQRTPNAIGYGGTVLLTFQGPLTPP